MHLYVSFVIFELYAMDKNWRVEKLPFKVYQIKFRLTIVLLHHNVKKIVHSVVGPCDSKVDSIYGLL